MSILEADESESGGIIEVSGFVRGRTGAGLGNDEAVGVQEDLEIFHVWVRSVRV